MLNNFAAWLRSAGVKDAAAVWHRILVRVLHGAVVVERIDDTQVQQQPIQHLHTHGSPSPAKLVPHPTAGCCHLVNLLAQSQ